MSQANLTVQKAPIYWFVSSSDSNRGDRTDEFLKNGYWQSSEEKYHLEYLKSMKVGDNIVLRTNAIRRKNLPFDNRGNPVSVMVIKAIGKIVQKMEDERTIKVEWERIDPPREWYFYTFIGKIWRVTPGDWAADALIAFAFENQDQDIDRFRNHPYWRERFGELEPDKARFTWTPIYEAIANKLLKYKNNRSELVAAIHEISKKVDGLTHLQDIYKDGTKGPLRDICPFTFFGTFNRGLTEANRKKILKEIADLLGVEEKLPKTFDSIPILNNINSWFFGIEKEREDDAIDVLWEVFEKAIRLADEEFTEEVRAEFIAAYDKALQHKGVGWNLTVGLYWIRPWFFLPLDSKSREYISQKLGIDIPSSGPGYRCTGYEYLQLRDKLEAFFYDENYPVHSFPVLSLEAWYYQAPEKPKISTEGSGDDTETESPGFAPAPYSIENIMADGCFLEREVLERMLKRLRAKKNLILQGAPGTGKTWLSKRLAFALIGKKDESKVCAVQFHPNLSYEDFVRGWRPSGEGHLALIDGPFMELIDSAKRNPEEKYVMIIEEINRGNPANILGELLTLLEADKRTPDAALELSYRRKEHELVYIPANIYVIGTMNIADRSLALVDFALRRRFAFITLEPTLGQRWIDWVNKKSKIPVAFLRDIARRVEYLNRKISDDPSLGPQFKVGHSFVTPPNEMPIDDPREWFREVVETEIVPLLEEYWYDALTKAQQAKEELLEGL